MNDKFKTVFKKIKMFLQSSYGFVTRHQPIECLIIALVLNITVEALSRHSLLSAFRHIFTSPLMFALNVLIIFATVVPALFFRRKYFIISVSVFAWLILGVSNFILLFFRQMPLSALDILAARSCFSVMGIYFKLYQIILIFLLIAACLAGLAFVWFKAPKQKVIPHIRSAISVVAAVATIFAVNAFTVKATVDPAVFVDLVSAYKDFGFAYCFSRSLLDTGIDKPDEYTKEKVDAWSEIIGEPDNSALDGDVNIIMVQLESFIDISRLVNVTTSADPTPTWNQLKKENSHGNLTVTAIGARTSNTEFEVLTSMSLAYFGVGEYPYHTILQKTESESAAFVLGSLGYRTHALHNHNATFYDRHIAYSALGFDTFTPLELMDDIEVNQLDWCLDSVLLDEIIGSVKASREKDFIFAVSVQPHGKYPTDYSLRQEGDITAEGFGKTEADDAGFEYYINQLRETDRFVADLIAELDALGEKYVLVLYGDHTPNFDIQAEDYSRSLYETEYVIVDNIGLEYAEVDLPAYRLTPYLYSLLGIEGGKISLFHQKCYERDDYAAGLEFLQYDVLYGKKYLYGDASPWTKTDITIGWYENGITEASLSEGALTVKGDRFNKYTAVLVNGERVETEFVDKNTVIAKVNRLKDGDTITVAQYTNDNLELTRSKEYTFKASNKGSENTKVIAP